MLDLRKTLAVTLFSGASIVALMPAMAGATDADTPHQTRRHAPAAAAGSDREELLERKVEQLEQEVQDLKASSGNGQVSSSQFEALQNQVYETQATVTSTMKSQASVKFTPAHLTISSPDGKYTFSPIVDVMGDWASYSAGQPLPNGPTNGKFDLKSSGENIRRAQIGFQGKFAGDFGYKFVYDFGGTNGDETYQGFAGPN